MWSGIRRSIVNCSRGRISIANSAVLVVRVVFQAGTGVIIPAVTHSATDAGYRAVNIQHAGSDAQKKQHDHPPRPRAEPPIDRPAQAGRDDYRDDKLDANADAETQPLLHRRAIANRRLSPDALRPRLVDLVAKPRQRIRRPAFAHSGKRNHRHRHRHEYAGARRNIVTPPDPVNAAPGPVRAKGLRRTTGKFSRIVDGWSVHPLDLSNSDRGMLIDT